MLIQCVNACLLSIRFVNVMDFCQSLDPRKGTQGEALEIVDESGAYMNCVGGVRGNRTQEKCYNVSK